MFTLARPTEEQVGRFLQSQVACEFSYPFVGATTTTPPAGYTVDHTRIRLGRGEAVFRAAQAALRNWDQFRLGWMEAFPAQAPIKPGQVVAVVARAAGLWCMNACRIVYVVDQPDVVERFGFAYGTLPDHVERGEERFLIEWNHATDEVWYDILAFSRPRHPLVWLGYPYSRRMQKRFARESSAALQRLAGGAS
jgi:uncharacterized protein (UPF0548 family)